MARSVPVTAMATESGENERLSYAVSAMQGYRETMEDAVSNLPAFCRIIGSIVIEIYMIDLLLVAAKQWRLMYSLLILQHKAVLNLHAATATSFFGVYDGHGGLIFNIIPLNKF